LQSLLDVVKGNVNSAAAANVAARLPNNAGQIKKKP